MFRFEPLTISVNYQLNFQNLRWGTVTVRSICLTCLITMIPTLAVANAMPICEELWFSRNAMLNDAGYCFSSPLGRSLFDNSDCTTKSPRLSAPISEQVSRIQALERTAPFGPGGACRVDTSQTTLTHVSLIDLRKFLDVHPSTKGNDGFCVGYLGEPIALHASPDENSEVLGQIPQGSTLSASHLPFAGWNFTIVQPTKDSGLPVMLGWYRGDLLAGASTSGTSDNCALLAG